MKMNKHDQYDLLSKVYIAQKMSTTELHGLVEYMHEKFLEMLLEINKKNKEIMGLYDEISDMNGEIHDLESENDSLQDEINELTQKLKVT